MHKLNIQLEIGTTENQFLKSFLFDLEYVSLKNKNFKKNLDVLIIEDFGILNKSLPKANIVIVLTSEKPATPLPENVIYVLLGENKMDMTSKLIRLIYIMYKSKIANNDSCINQINFEIDSFLRKKISADGYCFVNDLRASNDYQIEDHEILSRIENLNRSGGCSYECAETFFGVIIV